MTTPRSSTARAFLMFATALGAALAPGADLPSTALPPGFPTGFPLPTGGRITRAIANVFGFRLTLRVDSAAGALEFYRHALAQAGYRVREGSLRPSGGNVPGQTVRMAGGLNFTTGSGYEESDKGGVDAFTQPDGDTLDVFLPRVGKRLNLGPMPWRPPAADARPRQTSFASLKLPAPFPWPPGHRNASVARSGDGVLSAGADVSAAPAAYAFYETGLRTGGYELREVWRPEPGAAVFLGRLAFRGHGQDGYLTLASDGNAARVTVKFFATGQSE